jgi:hypothetical protein
MKVGHEMFISQAALGKTQVVTKRYRLSWLTNSALVYEPKCGGREGVAGSQPMSTALHRSPNKLWRSNSIFNLWNIRTAGRVFSKQLSVISSLQKTAQKSSQKRFISRTFS